jgi:hypothetical protein
LTISLSLNALVSAFRVHCRLGPQLFEHALGDERLENGMRCIANKPQIHAFAGGIHHRGAEDTKGRGKKQILIEVWVEGERRCEAERGFAVRRCCSRFGVRVWGSGFGVRSLAFAWRGGWLNRRLTIIMTPQT